MKDSIRLIHSFIALSLHLEFWMFRQFLPSLWWNLLYDSTYYVAIVHIWFIRQGLFINTYL